MKQRLGLMIALAVLLSVVMVAVSDDSDESSAAAPSSYTDIHVGESKSVSISSSGSAKYFRFIPTETAYYKFYSTNYTGDPYGYLLDSSGNSLISDDDGGTDRNYQFEYLCYSSTTYYIKSAMYSSNTGSYTIHVETVIKEITTITDVEMGVYPLNTPPSASDLPNTVIAYCGSTTIDLPVVWNVSEISKELGDHEIHGTVTSATGFILSGMTPTLHYTLSDAVHGIADIVFIVDTTGSMSSCISSVKNNLLNFAKELDDTGVSTRWGLVEYRDITCDGNNSTKIIKNGSSNWYDTATSLNSGISKLTADGGGDTPETVIDALEKALTLDFRGSASKFFIVVTDADYKNNNNYGISNMTEEISRISSKKIYTSVVTTSSYFSTYRTLTTSTNGLLVNISSNFSAELLNLADKIGTVAGNVTDISLSAMPVKVDYVEGDNFDPSGMIINALLSNGVSYPIDEYEISPSGPLPATTTQITITFRTHVITIPVTVLCTSHSIYTDTIVVQPTCLDKGIANRVCDICGTDLGNVEVDAIGHDYIYHSGQSPTCTEEGYEPYYFCSRCDLIFDLDYSVIPTFIPIAAIGHDPIYHDGFAPSTHTKGWAPYETCSRCDHTTYTELPATWASEGITILSEGACGDDAYYTVYSDGYMEIVGNGPMWNFADETSVPWYAVRDEIVTVIIGHGITAIGDRSFYKCTNLVTADIPDTVERIGKYAFFKCSSLVIETIGSSVESVGEHSFQDCTSITEIDLSGPVRELGESVFEGCVSVVKITISETVSVIGNYAFKDCVSLVVSTIPDSVREIGTGMYQGCRTLGTVILPKAVEVIGNAAFYGCESLSRIDFPGTLREIGHQAFEGCRTIVDVYIPETVKIIRDNAFKGCSDLNEVRLDGVPDILGKDVFKDCPSLEKFTGPSAAVVEDIFLVIKDTLVIVAEGMTTEDVTVPSSVKVIDDYAFYGCSSIKTLTIEPSVISIGEYAFYGCESLRTVTITSSVTHIGDAAFSACTSLEGFNGTYPGIVDGILLTCDGRLVSCAAGPGVDTVEIPEGITSIGYSAFDGCIPNIVSLTIPSTVISIETGSEDDPDKTGSFDGIMFIHADRTTVLAHDATALSGHSYIGDRDGTMQMVCVHSGDEITVVTEPTCTEHGESFFICEVCGDTVTIVTEPLGHDLVHHAAKEATCVEPGWDAYETCSRCDHTTFELIDIGGHRFTLIGEGPTCTEGGVFDAVCSLCGEEGTVEMSALGHSYVRHAGKEPTCMEPGWNVYTTCKRCDYTTFEEIPALGADIYYKLNDIVIAYWHIPGGTEVPHAENAYFEGLEFIGWDGYTDGMVAYSDLEFQAVFDSPLPIYQVTFSFGPYSIGYTAEYGTAVSLPPMDPTRAPENGVSYTFTGWNGYTDGMVITEDLEFVAMFESSRSYMVTVIYSDGGESSVRVNEGSVLDDPRQVFKYYKDEEMTVPWSPLTKIYHDVTVYALTALEGSAGGDTYWTLDMSTGTLRISGTGATDDWKSTTTPWYAYRNYITGLEVEEGVTYLGAFACHKYPFLMDIVLSDDLEMLGRYSIVSRIAEHISVGTGLRTVSTGGLSGMSLYDYYNPVKITAKNIVGKEYFGIDGVLDLGYVHGTVGEVEWSLDVRSGSFEFNGEGDVPSMDVAHNAPWYDYRTAIVSVTVGEGITSLGSFLFYDCDSIRSIVLSDTVTDVAKYSFKGCDNIEHVEFGTGLVTYNTLSLSVTLYNSKGLTKIASVDKINGHTFDLVDGKLIRTA